MLMDIGQLKLETDGISPSVGIRASEKGGQWLEMLVAGQGSRGSDVEGGGGGRQLHCQPRRVREGWGSATLPECARVGRTDQRRCCCCSLRWGKQSGSQV
ncbi:unnamed protein product [Prorocentrum cordatum]|uniref:Uncharacterized protein n=1 Tax=Prorocentrum cordatum TaxID=2364126 RepID=A0ABN9V6X9_9DINO|nr:unnamed protein product [Polarella glacialis]